MANVDTNILSKEATNITQLFSETDIIKTARSFNFTFWYIDDVLSLNNLW